MSIDKPIIPFLTDQAKNKAGVMEDYIYELEKRVKDLVEIRDDWKVQAKKNEAKVEILMEVIEVLK